MPLTRSRAPRGDRPEAARPVAYHLGRLARHESVIGQSVVTPRHGETTKQANGDYKAMNRNQLFLNSLEELERLTRIPQSHVTEYETLRISALLRLRPPELAEGHAR
jgi:hypothetical protein